MPSSFNTCDTRCDSGRKAAVFSDDDSDAGAGDRAYTAIFTVLNAEYGASLASRRGELDFERNLNIVLCFGQHLLLRRVKNMITWDSLSHQKIGATR
jgi:hypothetical protein